MASWRDVAEGQGKDPVHEISKFIYFLLTLFILSAVLFYFSPLHPQTLAATSIPSAVPSTTLAQGRVGTATPLSNITGANASEQPSLSLENGGTIQYRKANGLSGSLSTAVLSNPTSSTISEYLTTVFYGEPPSSPVLSFANTVETPLFDQTDLLNVKSEPITLSPSQTTTRQYSSPDPLSGALFLPSTQEVDLETQRALQDFTQVNSGGLAMMDAGGAHDLLSQLSSILGSSESDAEKSEEISQIGSDSPAVQEPQLQSEPSSQISFEESIDEINFQKEIPVSFPNSPASEVLYKFNGPDAACFSATLAQCDTLDKCTQLNVFVNGKDCMQMQGGVFTKDELNATLVVSPHITGDSVYYPIHITVNHVNSPSLIQLAPLSGDSAYLISNYPYETDASGCGAPSLRTGIQSVSLNSSEESCLISQQEVPITSFQTQLAVANNSIDITSLEPEQQASACAGMECNCGQLHDYLAYHLQKYQEVNSQKEIPFPYYFAVRTSGIAVQKDDQGSQQLECGGSLNFGPVDFTPLLTEPNKLYLLKLSGTPGEQVRNPVIEKVQFPPSSLSAPTKLSLEGSVNIRDPSLSPKIVLRRPGAAPAALSFSFTIQSDAVKTGVFSSASQRGTSPLQGSDLTSVNNVLDSLTISVYSPDGTKVAAFHNRNTGLKSTPPNLRDLVAVCSFYQSYSGGVGHGGLLPTREGDCKVTFSWDGSPPYLPGVKSIPPDQFYTLQLSRQNLAYPIIAKKVLISDTDCAFRESEVVCERNLRCAWIPDLAPQNLGLKTDCVPKEYFGSSISVKLPRKGNSLAPNSVEQHYLRAKSEEERRLEAIRVLEVEKKLAYNAWQSREGRNALRFTPDGLFETFGINNKEIIGADTLHERYDGISFMLYNLRDGGMSVKQFQDKCLDPNRYQKATEMLGELRARIQSTWNIPSSMAVNLPAERLDRLFRPGQSNSDYKKELLDSIQCLPDKLRQTFKNFFLYPTTLVQQVELSKKYPVPTSYLLELSRIPASLPELPNNAVANAVLSCNSFTKCNSISSFLTTDRSSLGKVLYNDKSCPNLEKKGHIAESFYCYQSAITLYPTRQNFDGYRSVLLDMLSVQNKNSFRDNPIFTCINGMLDLRFVPLFFVGGLGGKAVQLGFKAYMIATSSYSTYEAVSQINDLQAQKVRHVEYTAEQKKLLDQRIADSKISALCAAATFLSIAVPEGVKGYKKTVAYLKHPLPSGVPEAITVGKVTNAAEASLEADGLGTKPPEIKTESTPASKPVRRYGGTREVMRNRASAEPVTRKTAVIAGDPKTVYSNGNNVGYVPTPDGRFTRLDLKPRATVADPLQAASPPTEILEKLVPDDVASAASLDNGPQVVGEIDSSTLKIEDRVLLNGKEYAVRGGEVVEVTKNTGGGEQSTPLTGSSDEVLSLRKRVKLAYQTAVLKQVIPQTIQDIVGRFKQIDEENNPEVNARQLGEEADAKERNNPSDAKAKEAREVLLDRAHDAIEAHVEAGLLTRHGATLLEDALKPFIDEMTSTCCSTGLDAARLHHVDMVVKKMVSSISYQDHITSGQIFSDHTWERHIYDDWNRFKNAFAELDGSDRSLTPTELGQAVVITLMHDTGYTSAGVVNLGRVNYKIAKSHPLASTGLLKSLYADLFGAVGADASSVLENGIGEDVDAARSEHSGKWSPNLKVEDLGRKPTYVEKVVDAVARHGGKYVTDYKVKTLNNAHARLRAMFTVTDELSGVKTMDAFRDPQIISSLADFSKAARLISTQDLRTVQISKTNKFGGFSLPEVRDGLSKVKSLTGKILTGEVSDENGNLYDQVSALTQEGTPVGEFRKYYHDKMLSSLNARRSLLADTTSEQRINQWEKAILDTTEGAFRIDASPLVVEETPLTFKRGSDGNVYAHAEIHISRQYWQKLLELAGGDAGEVKAQVTKMAEDFITHSMSPEQYEELRSQVIAEAQEKSRSPSEKEIQSGIGVKITGIANGLLAGVIDNNGKIIGTQGNALQVKPDAGFAHGNEIQVKIVDSNKEGFLFP